MEPPRRILDKFKQKVETAFLEIVEKRFQGKADMEIEL